MESPAANKECPVPHPIHRLKWAGVSGPSIRLVELEGLNKLRSIVPLEKFSYLFSALNRVVLRREQNGIIEMQSGLNRLLDAFDHGVRNAEAPPVAADSRSEKNAGVRL